MKITILGSGHGNPTLQAFQTSILLEEQGNYYLLDAGDGAASLLIRQNVDPSALRGIFITHFHLDHSSCLPLLIHLGKKHRWLYPGITPEIFLPEGGKEVFVQQYCLLNHFKEPFGVRFRDMRSESYEDEAVQIHFTPTGHIASDPADGSPCSFAVSVQTGEKKILFTGDLKGDFSDFPLEEASTSNIIFCELTHYSPEKALEIFRTLSPEKLVFYHLHGPYQIPEGRERIRKLYQDLPFEVILGFDSWSLSV
jgi:ribonuclease BN (tRNA processing enzyme)